MKRIVFRRGENHKLALEFGHFGLIEDGILVADLGPEIEVTFKTWKPFQIPDVYLVGLGGHVYDGRGILIECVINGEVVEWFLSLDAIGRVFSEKKLLASPIDFISRTFPFTSRLRIAEYTYSNMKWYYADEIQTPGEESEDLQVEGLLR